MSRNKRLAADGLFVAQVALAVIFCGKQFLHMLSLGAEGVSIAMFISVEVFVGINLILSVHAHRVQPSRVTWQAMVAYGLWTVLWGANLLVLLYYLLVTGAMSWAPIETWTSLSLAICLALIAVTARRRGLKLNDPMVRGYGALVFKALPQFFQGGKFFLQGGMGWNPVSVALGHVTIFIRLGQLALSIREAGWDRNRHASLISEIGNELSWIFATAGWLWWRFVS